MKIYQKIIVLFLVQIGCVSMNHHDLNSVEYATHDSNLVRMETNGDKFVFDGNYIVALMEYHRVLALLQDTSKDADKLRLRGKIAWVYLKSSQWAQAELMFDELTKKNPKDSTFWEGLGLTYLSVGKTELAREAFVKATETDETRWKSLNALGVIYNMNNQPDLAVSMFDRAKAINPVEAEIYNNQGFAFMLKKDFQNAEISLKKALELRPNYELAQNNLGILYVLTNQIPDSLSSFGKSVGDQGAYNNVGSLLYFKGDPLKAAEYFRKAIEISPTYYPLAVDNYDALKSGETIMK